LKTEGGIPGGFRPWIPLFPNGGIPWVFLQANRQTPPGSRKAHPSPKRPSSGSSLPTNTAATASMRGMFPWGPSRRKITPTFFSAGMEGTLTGSAWWSRTSSPPPTSNSCRISTWRTPAISSGTPGASTGSTSGSDFSSATVKAAAAISSSPSIWWPIRFRTSRPRPTKSKNWCSSTYCKPGSNGSISAWSPPGRIWLSTNWRPGFPSTALCSSIP